MSHVTYLSKEDAAESVRPIYDAVESKMGSMLNLFKAMAHSPDLFQGFMALNSALGTTTLDPKLRELAYLRASKANDCGYCLHYHTQAGQQAGLSQGQIAAVGQTEPGSDFDELQWDVIRFADQVSRGVRADAELMARLKQKLSDRELVELAMTVALANFTNRMNESLQIELP